ncbi:bacteriocin immunity protein [Pectobacterium polaris]|uniref:bacteriocin immunity protein n=1 Tax=Pectobacterium polaris TaxID=2042057 RepID=UPI000D617B1D|nr:bacteriocin immunity protein [Pectobacterium polaris]MCU1789360.1 bacteriocin immunity protein [Pectobacterium polaris]PWD56312.1 bacteriocin immunity protein [Pectobacterium polaris]
MFKERIEHYLEVEVINLLEDFFYNPKGLKGDELTDHLTELTEHIVKITGHPEGSDLIFYPPDGREDSPEGIVNEIKRWRKSQGLPLFKDSE